MEINLPLFFHRSLYSKNSQNLSLLKYCLQLPIGKCFKGCSTKLPLFLNNEKALQLIEVKRPFLE
jgi:hypothetical protein